MIQSVSQHPFLRFLTDDSGDMVERGLILVAIVVAAVGLWYALGAKLAAKLGEVVGSF
jgi:Flp pilus assembly pilin Flp